MSLKQLLKWHYFSIQTNEFAGIGDSGAINRKDGWQLEHENLRCNLQATLSSTSKGRDDTIQKYGIKELEIYFTLFHNYDNIIFNENRRILVHRNPKLPVDIINGKSDIRIMEFIGAREPVAIRARGLTLFECYLRQIFRQSL